MNNCRTYKKMMPDAYYGELAPAAQEKFDSHLNQCSTCFTEWRRLKSTLGLMDEPVAQEPDARFWDEFTDRLTEKLPSAEQRWPFPARFR